MQPTKMTQPKFPGFNSEVLFTLSKPDKYKCFGKSPLDPCYLFKT